jgi:hypothetical protein
MSYSITDHPSNAASGYIIILQPYNTDMNSYDFSFNPISFSPLPVLVGAVTILLHTYFPVPSYFEYVITTGFNMGHKSFIGTVLDSCQLPVSILLSFLFSPLVYSSTTDNFRTRINYS